MPASASLALVILMSPASQNLNILTCILPESAGSLSRGRRPADAKLRLGLWLRGEHGMVLRMERYRLIRTRTAQDLKLEGSLAGHGGAIWLDSGPELSME